MRTESSPARTDGHRGQPSARSLLPGQRHGDGKGQGSSTGHCQPQCPWQQRSQPCPGRTQHSFTLPSNNCSSVPCPFWRLQHPPSTQIRAGAAAVPSPWGSPGSGHTITNHHGHQHRTGLISQPTRAALCPHLGPPSAALGAARLGLIKSRGCWPARPWQPNHSEMGLRALAPVPRAFPHPPSTPVAPAALGSFVAHPGCAQQCVPVAHSMSPVTPTEQLPSLSAPEKSSGTAQAELWHIQQEPFPGWAGDKAPKPSTAVGEATAAPNGDV